MLLSDYFVMHRVSRPVSLARAADCIVKVADMESDLQACKGIASTGLLTFSAFHANHVLPDGGPLELYSVSQLRPKLAGRCLPIACNVMARYKTIGQCQALSEQHGTHRQQHTGLTSGIIH